jgi:hypothetical protein
MYQEHEQERWEWLHGWMDTIVGWDGWWSFTNAWEWVKGQKQRETKHQSHEIRYVEWDESNEWKETKLWL